MLDVDDLSEVEFRDGKRLVPRHLSDMMLRLPTHRMTYEEAVKAANRQNEKDYLNAQRDRVLAAHFREFR